jgi:hypothetical protein
MMSLLRTAWTAAANIIMAPAVLAHEATHVIAGYPWLAEYKPHMNLTGPVKVELTWERGTPLRAAQMAYLAPFVVGMLSAPFVAPYVSLTPLGVYLGGLWATYTVTSGTDLRSAVALEHEVRQETIEDAVAD